MHVSDIFIPIAIGTDTLSHISGTFRSIRYILKKLPHKHLKENMDDFLKDNLNNQFAFLLRQLENVEKAYFKKHPIPQKWSIHEHLAHLGRYQEIFLERLAVILKGEVPYLERYKADNDSKFHDWCEQTSEEIIEKTILIRKEIIDKILGLTAEEIQQIGIHPKLGRMNVADWTTFFLLHEAHHIYAIFGLKQRFCITEN